MSINVVLVNLQSGSALNAREKSKLCNPGAEVIRPSTRCFSFLGYQLVPLLETLFKAVIWYFVFWQELWRHPRSTTMKDSMSTQRPHRKQPCPMTSLACSPFYIHKWGGLLLNIPCLTRQTPT